MAKHVLNRLSARSLEKPKSGKHRDGGGLILVVSDAGTAKWIFRYALGGRSFELGLGPAKDVPLAAARARATEYRALLAKGENPKAAHQAQAVPEFGDWADKYIETHEAAWRNAKHVAQWRMTLTKYAAQLRSKRVNEISTDDVLSVLKPIWTEKPETASRLRGRIEVILDAARARGFRAGENPAAWRGHLDKLLTGRGKTKGVKHHTALPFEEVPAFIADLKLRPATSARALEFLILTAARTGEVIGARWPEIDLSAKLWTVPAERMKAGRIHRVPLSGRAVTILKEMEALKKADAGFVFPSIKRDRPLSNMAFSALLDRMKIDTTGHGFRSAFRDWAGEKTTFPREVAEAALAHVVGDATERAYRRGDALEKRRKLMDAWAAFIGDKKANNIVQLNRR